MNQKRNDAFYHWWMFEAPEDGRMTPTAIWDAACDWMIEELRQRVEESFNREKDGNENAQG